MNSPKSIDQVTSNIEDFDSVILVDERKGVYIRVPISNLEKRPGNDLTQNISNNRVPVWNDSTTQFEDSLFSDDGSDITQSTGYYRQTGSGIYIEASIEVDTSVNDPQVIQEDRNTGFKLRQTSTGNWEFLDDKGIVMAVIDADTGAGNFRIGNQLDTQDVLIKTSNNRDFRFRNGSDSSDVDIIASGISLDRRTTIIGPTEINLLYGMSGTTGTDTDFVSGTSGTDGNLLEWNSDGDAVDSGVASSDMVQSVDTTQQAISINRWGNTEWNATTLFVQTQSNTLSPGSFTSIFAGGVGSKNLSADYLVPGKTIKVRSRGTVSLGSGDTIDVQVLVGGSGNSTGPVFSSLTPSSQNYELEVDIVCRTEGATGSVYMIGFLRIMNSSGNEDVAQIAGTSVTVDTTSTNLVDVQALLSDSSNDNITSEIAYITKEA